MFDGLARAGEKPGLALVATDDPYVGGEVLGRKAAVQVQAQVGIIDGEGHWWMCTNPEKGARIINDFLKNL